jgi:hypothetical protein
MSGCAGNAGNERARFGKMKMGWIPEFSDEFLYHAARFL